MWKGAGNVVDDLTDVYDGPVGCTDINHRFYHDGAYRHPVHFSPGRLMVFGRNWGWGLGVGSTDEAYTTTRWHTIPLQDIAHLTVGQHTYGCLLNDGTLYCWGGGAPSGQVASPELVPGEWQAVSMGYNFGIGLAVNGDLYTWGDNADYRTGQDTNVGRSTVPVKIGEDFKHVSAFLDGGLAIKTSGHLFSWGVNTATGLGSSTGSCRFPTYVGALLWKDVEGGRDDAIGITTTGAVYGWGVTRNGSNGHTSNKTVPTLVTGLPTCDRCVRREHVVSSFLGNGVYSTTGDLWLFGRNSFGNLLPPTITTLVKTNRGNTWKDFQIGTVTSQAMDHDDRVFVVGQHAWDNVSQGYYPITAAPGSVDNVEMICRFPMRLMSGSTTTIMVVPE